MFVEQLRRAVEASPRIELAKVAGLLWRAYAAGQVSEDQASELSDLIESKRALPAAQKPIQRRLGSRPRFLLPASMERRRRWAASGALPPALACRFTLAETAVLAVIAAEVVRHSCCTLTVGHIAALAGVSETTVRNALRAARGLGLVTIEERRLTAWRNAPNVVRIVSREWLAWLRLRAPKERARGRVQIGEPHAYTREEHGHGGAAEPDLGCQRAGSREGGASTGSDHWDLSPSGLRPITTPCRNHAERDAEQYGRDTFQYPVRAG